MNTTAIKQILEIVRGLDISDLKTFEYHLMEIRLKMERARRQQLIDIAESILP